MEKDLINKLDKEVEQLKAYLSQFPTYEVMCSIANDMMLKKQKLLTEIDLSAPHKQLLYLAGLLFSTERSENKTFKESSYKRTKEIVQRIAYYYEELFFPTEEEYKEGLSETWKNVRKVSMPVFLNYFNTSPLLYQEQLIERIQSWFTPFDELFIENIGAPIKTLIEIYLFIQNYIQYQFDELFEIRKAVDKEYKAFFESINGMNDLTLEELREHASTHPVKKAFELLAKKIRLVYQVPINELEDKFDKQIINNFLTIFSLKRKKREFRYYTEKNPLELSPLWYYSDEFIFCAFLEQLLIAIYNFSYITLENSEKSSKFYKHRDRVSESKTLKVFKKLFKEKAKYYPSIFENDQSQNEHDILIIYKNILLIVEIKASKFKEPFRDPDKAFIRIKRDFNSSTGLQKAYNQSIHLNNLILSQNSTQLFDKNGNLVIEIIRDSIKKIYKILVTVEQMGIIACNLSLLLKKPENEPFPWACNLCDLETIIDGFNYKKLSTDEFFIYLDSREKLHKKFYCWDELEICGYYLLYGDFNKLEESDVDEFVFTPGMSDIFDKIYFEKLGIEFDFEAEKEPILVDINSEISKILNPKSFHKKKQNIKSKTKKKNLNRKK